MKVDFATFCYSGDAHRLHAPGQLARQVESNGYEFNKVIVIYQGIRPEDYPPPGLEVQAVVIQPHEVDEILSRFGVDLEGQYRSDTDRLHWWKHHVVNHLRAVEESDSDYIVFADADCWIVRSGSASWVDIGISVFDTHQDVFIISPNDGEELRQTRRMSQQMFMARTKEFRNADFNQPGWDGNTNIPGGPMPEYWAMLEGRMELHCRAVNKWRYVLPEQWRYWHHNRLRTDGSFETDLSKY